MNNTCQNCKFYLIGEKGFGTCHRMPPQITNAKDGAYIDAMQSWQGFWPVVNEWDFCGMFQEGRPCYKNNRFVVSYCDSNLYPELLEISFNRLIHEFSQDIAMRSLFREIKDLQQEENYIINKEDWHRWNKITTDFFKNVYEKINIQIVGLFIGDSLRFHNHYKNSLVATGKQINFLYMILQQYINAFGMKTKIRYSHPRNIDEAWEQYDRIALIQDETLEYNLLLFGICQDINAVYNLTLKFCEIHKCFNDLFSR